MASTMRERTALSMLLPETPVRNASSILRSRCTM